MSVKYMKNFEMLVIKKISDYSLCQICWKFHGIRNNTFYIIYFPFIKDIGYVPVGQAIAPLEKPKNAPKPDITKSNTYRSGKVFFKVSTFKYAKCWF